MAVESSPSPADFGPMDDLCLLVERAQSSDATALPEIRGLVDDPKVWQRVGDLAARSMRAWLTLLAAAHPDALAATERALAAVKADLAGDRPTPVERVLVDQILCAWAETRYYDCTPAGQDDAAHTECEHSRRQGAAERRYLAARTALATVRRLLPAPPALSVFRPSPEE